MTLSSFKVIFHRQLCHYVRKPINTNGTHAHTFSGETFLESSTTRSRSSRTANSSGNEKKNNSKIRWLKYFSFGLELWLTLCHSAGSYSSDSWSSQAGVHQPDLASADAKPAQRVQVDTKSLRNPGQLQEIDNVFLGWGRDGNMSPVFLLLSWRKCSSSKSCRLHQSTIMLGQRRFGGCGFPHTSWLFLLHPLYCISSFLPQSWNALSFILFFPVYPHCFWEVLFGFRTVLTVIILIVNLIGFNIIMKANIRACLSDIFQVILTKVESPMLSIFGTTLWLGTQT